MIDRGFFQNPPLKPPLVGEPKKFLPGGIKTLKRGPRKRGLGKF